MKKLLLITSLLFASFFMHAQNDTLYANTTTVSFDVVGEVFDYGAQINQVKIHYDSPVQTDAITNDTYQVTTDYTLEGVEVENGERVIEQIEFENENKTVILHLSYGVDVGLAYVLYWDDDAFLNHPLTVQYQLTSKAIPLADGSELQPTYNQGNVSFGSVDAFTSGESSSGIHYRDYKPKDDGNKHPLIIWFHGAGEGGDNNITQILGNKGASAFVSDEAQTVFDVPFVLAPQSSTFWMPELTLWDELTLTGEDQTEAVVDMIKEYIEQNPNIDTDRVYIGGGSMGGYQVWETLFAAPELFAAAFPICQAYEVPQDKLETVKDIPIWMAHTKTDDTIPVSYSQDAYTNAKALGLNITYTEFESVEVDGVELETHAAWVYLLNNNATNEEDEQFFDWLAAQKKVDAIIEDDSSNNDTLFVGAIVGVTVLALAFSYLRSKKQN